MTKQTYTLDDETIHDPPYNPWGFVAKMEQRLKEEIPFIEELMREYDEHKN